MDNEYLEKYFIAIKKAKTKKTKLALLNKLYEDGFEDGYEQSSYELSYNEI